MSAGRKVLVGVVSLVVAVVVIAAVALYVVTSTNWGHERVRRVVLNDLAGMVHGKASIGQVSGDLLHGMTLHDLTITDSTGAPFVAVQSVTANYSIAELYHKRILLDHAVLVRPVIVLNRPPRGAWNWQLVFPHDTTPTPPSTQTKWGDWIKFTNAEVVNGQLIVLTPWSPATGLSPSAADSVTRDALRGNSRLVITRVPGGFQKRLQLDSVSARIPLLRLSEPGYTQRLLEVSSLSMDAYPFRPPGALVRNLRGTFPFTNDSVWWKGAYAEFPASKQTGDGSYTFLSGDLTLAVHADPASLADVQWVYPRLPADGHGKLDLALKWRGALQDYQLANADVTIGRSHATGAFGITLGDTITIHDTDLRFSGIGTKTLAELIPGFRSPRPGVFDGHAAVHGGRHALVVDGDVTFVDERAGPSRVIAAGEIGFLDHGNVQARDLRLQLSPVQVAMARTWDAQLPVGGIVTGTTTLNGSTDTQMAMSLDLTHSDRGEVSSLAGSATLHFPGETRIDADVTARPISLVEVGRFFPSAGLQGSASGPIHTRGPVRDLRIDTDLRLPDSGRFVANGTLDLANKEKGYDLATSLYTFNLRTIDSKAPVTSLTARVTAAGRGTDVATLYSKVAADFSTSHWMQGSDSIAFDTVSIRATAANGMANVERLFAAGAQTRATVSGSFGLVANKSDSLTYAIDVDSLGALNRWFPRAPDTTAVPPRPAVTARIIAGARADSARTAQRTEMERLLNGRPGPRLVVNKPAPVPRDTLLGRVHLAGTLRGNVDAFDLRGHAEGDSIVARGNAARRVTSDYEWTGVRTPSSKASVSVSADQLSARGFAFDTVAARVTYAIAGPEDEGGSGQVELVLMQGDTANSRRYAAKGDYALFRDRSELRLADLTLQFDTASWSMPHPDTVQWGKGGVRVSNFELHNRGNGRVRVNGLMPTEGVADLTMDVDNFPVANVMDMVQSDLKATGDVAFHGTMRGSSSSPSFQGTFGLTRAQYDGTTFPDLLGRASYADQVLVTHVDVLHGTGRPITTADARLPINLAFSGVSGDRRLPQPMTLDVAGDSLPVDLIPEFTDLVTNVHGHVAGKFTMRGTFKRPSLTGSLTFDHAATTITASGSAIDNITGSVRMEGDTVFVDSLAGNAIGSVRVTGTLGVGNWREPSFALELTSDGARLINNNYADLRVDSKLKLTGPFAKALLNGDVTVDQGVLFAPESSDRNLVGSGDPGLFNVVDTTSELAHQLFPPQSALLRHLTMDLSVRVNPNTWVRNREANVEIHTDDPLTIHDADQTVVITGVVATERGEYNLLSKRFQISRGSAMFSGRPGLNPTLQVTGEYLVNVAARGPVNIRVLIGGTLQRPNVSLESDAQPPKTQSELLTLLAFGQSTSSLVASNNSSIASTGASTDLVGTGAQFAARRLATVALGVAADQTDSRAGRALGTDVFDITPSDVPTELGSGGLNGFLNQTKIEAGKYVTSRTFASLQEQARNIGASIEHRTPDGWRFNATFEPRLLLQEPTLNSQPFRPVRSIGVFILRDWRF
jgi:translocation and assembly module TamB